MLAKDNHNVLYLNSYHYNYYWSQEVTNGVLAVFDTMENTNLYLEYMDTKRLVDSSYYALYFKLLQNKYSQLGIDAILCADNNALDLVLQNRDNKLFDKPVVFCGIYNVDDYLPKYNNIYGVKEDLVLEESINFMISILHDVRKIHVVLDNSVTSAIYKEILDTIKLNKKNVEIDYLIGLKISEIPERVKSIAPPDYIKYIGVNYDADSNRVDPKKVAEIIAANCPGPVFGNIFINPEAKLLGGITIKGYEQGLEAAKLINGLLHYKQIPKLITPSSCYVVDYEVAKKHNVDLNQLPKDAVIVNQPDKMLVKYRMEAISIFSLLIVLSLIIVSLISNISKRRAYEKQLITAIERAEQSDKLKSSFLTNMSHEIRTPLNAIMGFTNLLTDEDIHQDELKQYVQYIITSAHSLQNLIGEILDISKIETGQMVISKEEFDLTNLMVEFYHTFQSPNLLKNNQLICSNSKDEKKLVYTDFYRLKQIVVNLIENALMYTEDGVVKYGYIINEQDIAFYVKDNGIGIPEKFQKHIFERFIRLEENDSNVRRGAGLGLSIAKKLCYLLDGNLWVESKSGIGSTFILHLRNVFGEKEEQSDLTENNKENDITKHGLHLVVADALEDSFEYIKGLFNYKYIIERAKSVNEAIEIVKTGKAGFLLLDYQLIQANIDFNLRHLRMNLPGVKIILQTPYDIELVPTKDMYDAIIEKPYNLATLIQTIAELI